MAKKVKIYIVSDKSPQFIGWQIKSIRDHLKDDFEYIVLNNSSSLDLDEQIQSECFLAGVKWFNIENKDFSHPCFSCSAPVQECIDKYISQDRESIHAIIDSDLFLTRDFSFNEIVEGYDLVGVTQARDTGMGVIEYLWNNFLIINSTAPNIHKLKMWPGTINHAHCDVGAMSYFYLLYNDVKLKRVPCTGIIIDHPEVMSLIPEHARSSYEFDMDMEIIEGSWLHFRGGSNWNYQSKEFYHKKEEFIKKVIGV